MPTATKEKPAFKDDVLFIVHEESGESGGTQIRVVRWHINDKISQPFLEKRSFRIQDGQKYFNKAKGFVKSDLNILVEKWEEIAKHMEG